MRNWLYSLLFITSCNFVFSQNCDSVSLENISNPGPYNYEVILESDGMRNGPNYYGATLYYPTDSDGPFASLVLVPGYVSPEYTVSLWGPFLASHGIIVMTIGTNSLTDLPQDRAMALLDAIQTLQEENNRENSPVYQNIDLDKFSVGGHSMGGGGAQIAATLNADLKSVISLTPWIQPWLVNSDYLNHSVPLLIISGENDSTASPDEHANVHYQYTPNSTPKALYEVQNGSHSVGNYPTSANNYMGKIVLAWLSNFLIGDECYYPLLLETPEFASEYVNNLESFNLTEENFIDISFYPNPVVDILTIKSDYVHQVSYEVINSLGQQLLDGYVVQGIYEIDLSSLKSGMYYIIIKENIFKFLKN